MCISPCATTGNNFVLTGTAGTTLSITSVTASSDACTYDFLVIPGGQDQATPFTVADRYCGGAFPASVCSTFDHLLLHHSEDKYCLIHILFAASTRPFRMTYGTDGSEPTTGATIGGTDNPVPTAAIPITYLADTANTGFCLNYQEK